jgi:hypothetical protein
MADTHTEKNSSPQGLEMKAREEEKEDGVLLSSPASPHLLMVLPLPNEAKVGTKL